ncbi:hypothetical protein QBC39DRAFT_398822 [Podospora conica]|nr:hypothetical protein QBC39DRAFT_398822 [Schizothecium conicum]
MPLPSRDAPAFLLLLLPICIWHIHKAKTGAFEAEKLQQERDSLSESLVRRLEQIESLQSDLETSNQERNSLSESLVRQLEQIESVQGDLDTSNRDQDSLSESLVRQLEQVESLKTAAASPPATGDGQQQGLAEQDLAEFQHYVQRKQAKLQLRQEMKQAGIPGKDYPTDTAATLLSAINEGQVPAFFELYKHWKLRKLKLQKIDEKK